MDYEYGDYGYEEGSGEYEEEYMYDDDGEG